MKTEESLSPNLKIRLECFGNRCHDSLSVVLQGREYSFEFSALAGLPQAFHAGLFFDYHAASWKNYLRYPRERRIAVIGEPNASEAFVVNPSLAHRFKWIFTHDERLVRLGKNFIFQPFGTSWLNVDITEDKRYDKTKLVSMIGAPHPEARAGHALRNEVIAWLKQRGGVDQFGKGIQWIDNKIQGLEAYAFSIAMENCSRNFYFTEKIIDCLLTDTIPIYWGCPGIAKHFDPRGYFHFESIDQLNAILGSLSWERYQEMLPYCLANRQKAIEQRWATRQQYFERLAIALNDLLAPNYNRSSSTAMRFALGLYQKLRRIKDKQAVY
jgi:hypothetical protein